MAGFDEVQFPPQISYGSRGGPEFMTDIKVTESGHEVRNINWAESRSKFDVAFGVKDMADLAALTKFFYARFGRAYGFRYKDWSDYTATQEVMVVTGSKFVQLIKSYTSGPRSYVRIIKKPVASPAVTMRRGGSPFSSFTLDTTTGIATLTPDSSATITAITQANPGQVTANSHGFSNGDKIWIDSVVGMTQVNNRVFTIANVAANTFTIGESTQTYTAYSSGGFARKFVQPGTVLDWTGEFDVPVRFDIDHLPTSLDEFSIGSAEGMILIELRDL